MNTSNGKSCLAVRQLFFVFWLVLTSLTAENDPAGKTGSKETLIRICAEREGALTHLFVENVQTAEVTVTLAMDLDNLKATAKFPFTTTLPGKELLKLYTLAPITPEKGWSWTYTYWSTFGSIKAVPDTNFVYRLPYAQGKAFTVSQGYNGRYSHFGADQFAIDWRLPLGTPVHAARGGKVVGVKSDSKVGGDDEKYDWDANYVLIEHSDGTLGQYVHLMKDGTKLCVGQSIEAGGLIGLSGNTGHSTGPHLHFSVFKARDGKHRQTLPMLYRTTVGVVELEEGRSYRAPEPAAVASVSLASQTPAEERP